jgi:hypothetical protein
MNAFDSSGKTSYDLEGLTEYYTEYPTTTFRAVNDDVALQHTKAKIVYRESDTIDGRPFIFLRKSD